MQILEIDRAGIALAVSQGFLCVREGEDELRTPIDEVDCVILNSYGAVLSNHVLIRLAEMNIPLLICGTNANPLGIMLPSAGNVYRKERVEIQLAAGSVLKKQLWQSIVRAKLRNQALLLRHHTRQHQDILALIPRVRSDDAGNHEAIAARRYWQRLFGTSFRRDVDAPGINTCLNYCYAIIRAAFCRQIAAAGLLPEYGLHHINKLNPFCLADDLMEPLRPFADRLVASLPQDMAMQLHTAVKRMLVTILDVEVEYRRQSCHLRNVIQGIVQDLLESYRVGKILMEYPEVNADG